MITRTFTARGTGRPNLAELRAFVDQTTDLPDETPVELHTAAPDRPGELTEWRIEATETNVHAGEQIGRSTKINNEPPTARPNPAHKPWGGP